MDRIRIAKLLGQLGEANARPAALDALDKAGANWGEISELVARGELSGGEADLLLRRLLIDRIKTGLLRAWAMASGEAAWLRAVVDLGAVGTSLEEMQRAIAIADEAVRRAR
jgi:hypothetical protein